MRRYRVRLTPEAELDLLRLYDFLLDKDPGAARRALEAIDESTRLLAFSPFSCRKVMKHDPFLRELVISFGSTGYVVLFEIESDRILTILAVRHQREEDYH